MCDSCVQGLFDETGRIGFLVVCFFAGPCQRLMLFSAMLGACIAAEEAAQGLGSLVDTLWCADAFCDMDNRLHKWMPGGLSENADIGP